MESQQEQPASDTTDGQTGVISVAQIQRLVRLLDHSDVSELELKLASEDMHLVLRKARATGDSASPDNLAYLAASNGAILSAGASEPAIVVQHKIVAPLVGIFHAWLKPGGKALAVVGEPVKVGQLLCTIESLNVFNEVESTVVGRIAEIQVLEGQPVEYGQILITIEPSEAEGA
jgi:acetyl-CoA carboxylase biotin carboxyl carrier protein